MTTPWLDGKHTVFGQVVDGFSVVKAMEACGSRSGETSQDVMIADSGVLTTASALNPSNKRIKVRQSDFRVASNGAGKIGSLKVIRHMVMRRKATMGVRPCMAHYRICAGVPSQSLLKI